MTPGSEAALRQDAGRESMRCHDGGFLATVRHEADGKRRDPWLGLEE
jgi:hypothetical protein